MSVILCINEKEEKQQKLMRKVIYQSLKLCTIKQSSGKVFTCSILFVADINRRKKHVLRKCRTNLRMVMGKFEESCENTVKSQIPEENGELECTYEDIPLHCWRVQGKPE